MEKFCFYCGTSVADGDWDYVGHTKLWVCSAPVCVRELRDAHRAVEEEAAFEASRDRFERYW